MCGDRHCCICEATLQDSEANQEGGSIYTKKQGNLWFCKPHWDKDASFMKMFWKYKKSRGDNMNTKKEESFKSAAIRILKESKKAMHYKEITKQAIEKGLVKTEGKTPALTMNARLCVDLKKEASPFVKSKPGFYELKEAQEMI